MVSKLLTEQELQELQQQQQTRIVEGLNNQLQEIEGFKLNQQSVIDKSFQQYEDEKNRMDFLDMRIEDIKLQIKLQTGEIVK